MRIQEVFFYETSDIQSFGMILAYFKSIEFSALYDARKFFTTKMNEFNTISLIEFTSVSYAPTSKTIQRDEHQMIIFYF